MVVPTVEDMDLDCDLVIPCRDEAAALPGVLAAVPPGHGGRRRRQRLDRRHRRRRPAAGCPRRPRVPARLRRRRPRRGRGSHARPSWRSSTGTAPWTLASCSPSSPRCAPDGPAMACGRRRPAQRGVWPWHARVGNAVVLAWLRRRTGLPVHDIAPVRVCRRDDLLALGVRDRRFGYPVELLVRAQQQGWVLTEHDITYHPGPPGPARRCPARSRGRCAPLATSRRSCHDGQRPRHGQGARAGTGEDPAGRGGR